MTRRQPIAKKRRKQGKCGLEKNDRYAKGGINVRGGKMGVYDSTSLSLSLVLRPFPTISHTLNP